MRASTSSHWIQMLPPRKQQDQHKSLRAPLGEWQQYQVVLSEDVPAKQSTRDYKKSTTVSGGWATETACYEASSPQ